MAHSKLCDQIELDSNAKRQHLRQTIVNGTLESKLKMEINDLNETKTAIQNMILTSQSVVYIFPFELYWHLWSSW